jgi:uncharacterized protein (TIGR02246 family)
MGHAGPLDVARAWGDAYAAKDLDAMMRLFDPDAVWVSAEGDVVAGSDAIRGVFRDFLRLDATYETDDEQLAQADGVALLSARWRIHGTDADGAPVEISGRTADVLRRNAEGEWRYAIDSPFGGG